MSNKADVCCSNVTDLIIARLSAYPGEVREMSIRAIKASEHLPEQAVADQIMALARDYANASEGDER